MSKSHFLVCTFLIVAILGLLVLNIVCLNHLSIVSSQVAKALSSGRSKGAQQIEVLYEFLDARVGIESTTERMVAAREVEDKSVPGLLLLSRCCDNNSGELIAFRPGTHDFAVLTDDGSVQIVDAHTCEETYILPRKEENILSCAFTGNGDALLTGTEEGNLFLWNLTTLKNELLVHLGDSPILRLDSAQKGDRVCWGAEEKVYAEPLKKNAGVFDLSTRSVLSRFSASMDTDYDNSLAISDDGTTVIAIDVPGHDGLCLLDAGTGEFLRSLEYADVFYSTRSGTRITRISPDEQYVAAGNAGRGLFVWDFHDGKIKCVLSYSDGAVTFSPGNRYLACYGKEGSVYVYDLFQYKVVGRSNALNLSNLCLSDDGELLLVDSGRCTEVFQMPDE